MLAETHEGINRYRDPAYEAVLLAHRLQYAQAQQDLGLFFQAAWDVLEPSRPLAWNWHHDLICEHLEAAYTGQIRRLIINIAPRTTKSLMATVCFPAWAWTLDPALRWLFGSYADTLATQHSVLRRNVIESDWYQAGYSHRFKLSSDSNTKSEFTNNKTGHMKALGIKGSVTGEGGDFIVIDDPHNPKGAESQAERETAIQNFDLAWSSRLNDKRTGRIIVIMQRLHERDLTGHLLQKELGYTHLKIPTVAEERQRLVFPMSGRVIEREQGDLMHPERDGPTEVEQAKKDLGPYGFSGQHQQNPVPSSGGLFTQDMFEFVDTLPDKFDYRFVTADTAYNDKKENDFTVFSAWGVCKGELYLIDVYRKQIQAAAVEVPATAFIKRFSQYGFRGAYIEPKGHGIYLNQALPKAGVLIPSENDMKTFFSDRRLNKTERASNAVPHLANRRIRIHSLIADKEILLAEVLGFPKAAHDDFTDTVVDAIKMAFGRSLSLFDVL